MHVNHHVTLAAGQRQRHQQRGKKLARDVAAHAHRLAEVNRGRGHAQRRVAVLLHGVYRRAHGLQGLHQIADGALVHARHAAELGVRTQQGQGRRKWAHGGAGVTQKNLKGRLGSAQRGRGGALQLPCGALALHAHPKLLQRFSHHLGVV